MWHMEDHCFRFCYFLWSMMPAEVHLRAYAFLFSYLIGELINCMYASVKEEARHQPSGCTFQKVSWIIPNRDIFSRQSRFFFIRDFGTWWFWRVLWFWSWHDCSSIQFGFLDFLLPYTRSICGALGVIMHETINESDVNIIVKEFTQSFSSRASWVVGVGHDWPKQGEVHWIGPTLIRGLPISLSGTYVTFLRGWKLGGMQSWKTARWASWWDASKAERVCLCVYIEYVSDEPSIAPCFRKLALTIVCSRLLFLGIHCRVAECHHGRPTGWRRKMGTIDMGSDRGRAVVWETHQQLGDESGRPIPRRQPRAGED